MNHHPPSDHCRASCWTSVVLLVALGLQWGLLPSSAETLKEPARADDRLSPAAFADPPVQTRPGCFWAWLNGSITAEQVTRDLEAMKQGGMRGGEIWDVAAMTDPDRRVPAGPPFLGPKSTRLIVHAIREADRLGLEVGLVASSGWNAGGSWIKPEHAGKGLYQSTTTVKGPTGFHDALPLPELPKNCPRDEQGRPSYLREVAVLAVPDNATKTIANADQVVDLTTTVGADGKLRWEVPAGDWAILRFVCLNHGQQLIVPSPNSGGPMIDFFDPRATEFHLRHIAGTILKELGRESFAGTSFKTMEFDSMELDGFTPWTEAMADGFHRQVGYPVIGFLPLLTGWKLADPEAQEQFLYDWNKFVSARLIESHYATGRKVLQSYGVKLIAEAGGPGPPIWNSNPVDGIQALGAVDIPRGEFWIRHRGIFLVKEIAAAAHVYDKRVVDAESFTTWRRWVDGPLNHKELADRALCEGLNCFSGHTFASSPPDAGLPGWAYHAGTDINPRATWWPMVRGLMDYLARCSYMLRQGWAVADVCYYYGDQSPNFFPPLCDVPDKPLLDGLAPQNDFDICSSEVILQRMTVENGRIVLPDGMSYAALVLPEQDHILPEVIRKIRALVADGATVIGHQRPTRAPGLQSSEAENQQVEQLGKAIWGPDEPDKQKVHVRSMGRGRFVIASDRTRALRKIGVGPDFEVAGRSAPDLGPLDFVHRKTGDDEFYFIRNKTKEPQTLTCRFRVAAEANGQTPEFWWPDSGHRSVCRDWKAVAGGHTELPVELGPSGSVFVVFRKGGGTGNDLDALARDTFPAAESPASLTLNGPWQVEFPEGWGAPRTASFEKLQSWTESDNEGIRFFSGIATYRKSFELPASLANKDRLFLQLGELAEIAEVTLNGKRLGLVWLPPYRIEISGATRASANQLEIRVANLWANRLNADSLLPESRRFTRSNLDRIQTDPTSDSGFGRVPRGKTRPFYTEIPPLTKSGLFGPVEVITPKAAVTVPKPGAAAMKGPSVLKPDSLRSYVAAFNRNDDTHFGQAVSNEAAADWLAANVPRFECPDKAIEEIYHFRWWTFRKHIQATPDGFVITEFLPKVSWSAKHNTISCAAGHHFREGRWISDPKYLDDYSIFWFRKGGDPRRYSFWAADSVYQRAVALGDFTRAIDLMPELIANYEAWEKAKLEPDGLFWQVDDRDGMEVSIGGQGKRPTINSYMYGDARAIAAIATHAAKPEIATAFTAKADQLQRLVLAKLWDDEAKFFKVLPRGEGAALVGVREEHGFTPWYFGLPLPGKGYEMAWKQLVDPQGFRAPFGPTTAEQRHPGFSLSYQGHECQWNGPSWPYATTVTLVALANVLNDYPQQAVSRQDYFDTLKTYTRSHRLKRDDGTVVPWIDENLNPQTGDWIARTRLKAWKNGTWDVGKGGVERGKDYNHSAYCDLIITGLVGLRVQAGDTVVVNPLLPEDTWDYFCLDGVPYHGRLLTILWDRNGERYQQGKGLRAFADGREIAASATLGRITGTLPEIPAENRPSRESRQ